VAQQDSDEGVTPLDLTPVYPPKVFVEPAPGTREPAEAKSVEPTEKKAAPAHHQATQGPSAEQALLWLKNGNKRYVTRATRTDGKSQKDRDRLTKGQHPHAIVLSCADSRVPTETVFDQALGEIFVVRTAGEGLDSSVIASLEYAVEHLEPRLLVIMGHTSCGAVKAAIETAEGQTAGSESLDKLLSDIRPRLPTRATGVAASKDLEIESSANAQGVAADLLKRSAIIKSRVEKGDLQLKPALYYIDSGVVKFY
jgi:carbonic anhydrase